MRLELRPHGIHVSTVHPVGTSTEFFEKAQTYSPEHAPVLNRTGNAEMQSPERVANAILKSLRKPRPEVWTSQPTRVAIQLCALIPRTTDRVLRTELKRRFVRKKSD